MVNWHGRQWMHRQTVVDRLHMRNGFPTKMIEQTIMTSCGDIKRISRA